MTWKYYNLRWRLHVDRMQEDRLPKTIRTYASREKTRCWKTMSTWKGQLCFWNSECASEHPTLLKKD